jgi:hypothetical protein
MIDSASICIACGQIGTHLSMCPGLAGAVPVAAPTDPQHFTPQEQDDAGIPLDGAV